MEQTDGGLPLMINGKAGWREAEFGGGSSPAGSCEFCAGVSGPQAASKAIEHTRRARAMKNDAPAPDRWNDRRVYGFFVTAFS